MTSRASRTCGLAINAASRATFGADDIRKCENTLKLWPAHSSTHDQTGRAVHSCCLSCWQPEATSPSSGGQGRAKELSTSVPRPSPPPWDRHRRRFLRRDRGRGDTTPAAQVTRRACFISCAAKQRLLTVDEVARRCTSTPCRNSWMTSASRRRCSHAFHTNQSPQQLATHPAVAISSRLPAAVVPVVHGRTPRAVSATVLHQLHLPLWLLQLAPARSLRSHLRPRLPGLPSTDADGFSGLDFAVPRKAKSMLREGLQKFSAALPPFESAGRQASMGGGCCRRPFSPARGDSAKRELMPGCSALRDSGDGDSLRWLPLEADAKSSSSDPASSALGDTGASPLPSLSLVICAACRSECSIQAIACPCRASYMLWSCCGTALQTDGAAAASLFTVHQDTADRGHTVAVSLK